MTTMSFKARPRWWDRERVQYFLATIESVAMFRKFGYSIAPPRYGRYGDRKETGFKLVFKNEKQKKAFLGLGLVQTCLTELENICKDRFLTEVDYHKNTVG